MRIHHILFVFVLISAISCQEPQPEVKEVLAETTKDLTDHIEILSPDTLPAIGNEARPEGPDNIFIQRKPEKGIDFFATGTEPL